MIKASAFVVFRAMAKRVFSQPDCKKPFREAIAGKVFSSVLVEERPVPLHPRLFGSRLLSLVIFERRSVRYF